MFFKQNSQYSIIDYSNEIILNRQTIIQTEINFHTNKKFLLIFQRKNSQRRDSFSPRKISSY